MNPISKSCGCPYLNFDEIWHTILLKCVLKLLDFQRTHLQPFFPSGETFSENFSHTEKCQPCTPCPKLMRMLTPCTDSNDAICVCDYGFFFSTVTGRCEACTVCPLGQGVLMRCNYDRDTICEECLDDTFSDQETSFDPCLPCTVCEQPDLELKSCSPVRDAMCQGRNITNCKSI